MPMSVSSQGTAVPIARDTAGAQVGRMVATAVTTLTNVVYFQLARRQRLPGEVRAHSRHANLTAVIVPRQNRWPNSPIPLRGAVQSRTLHLEGAVSFASSPKNPPQKAMIAGATITAVNACQTPA